MTEVHVFNNMCCPYQMFVFAPHCLKMREREKKRKGSNQFVEIYKNKVNVNSSETHNKLIHFNVLLNTIQTTYTVKILRAVIPLKNRILSQNTQYIHNLFSLRKTAQ